MNATVDIKLMLAYTKATSSKNELRTITDIIAINKIACVEKLFTASNLL